MKVSYTSSLVSKPSNVISAPASRAASAMFFSVVVPTLVHTTEPSVSATVLEPEKPSLTRAINCWPS